MVTMIDAREVVADAILSAFPDLETAPILTSFPGPSDPPQRGTVLIGSSKIDPPNVACPVRVYSVRVWVVSAITAPGAGDDDVDRLVGLVLDGLDSAGHAWSDVTRGTWLDANPSYVLTVEVTP